MGVVKRIYGWKGIMIKINNVKLSPLDTDYKKAVAKDSR